MANLQRASSSFDFAPILKLNAHENEASLHIFDGEKYAGFL